MAAPRVPKAPPRRWGLLVSAAGSRLFEHLAGGGHVRRADVLDELGVRRGDARHPVELRRAGGPLLELDQRAKRLLVRVEALVAGGIGGLDEPVGQFPDALDGL